MGKKYKIEQSAKKQRWNILGGADGILENQLMAGSNIEILGNSVFNLDGCLGVLDYKDSYIKLKLQKGAIILWGQCFDIAFFEGRLITVKGKISSIEFCV